ncbi:MAG: CCA tRNA nucleotidyltransferase [Atopobiaceae bacterium]|nr:CCA tRNA nucleotidyltransferase [Atopobiaceae bacterium]
MDSCDKTIASVMPEAARCVIEALEAAGHEAWIVGGWVRDALRGAASHDVDVTTSAPWPVTTRVLRAAGMAVHETGTAHGTVTAVCAGETVEVTTYRVETGYSDHRHPDEVHFVQDVEQDLARRDLTINAMAWHPTRGLLDPFGGRNDLVDGIVRTVGNPAVRFGEDALRMLRTVRFAVRFGFAMERQTHKALLDKLYLLREVAPERMGQEVDAIVQSGRAGTALLAYPEVMCAAIPELAAARGFDQRSVYHVYDVYEHIAHVCNACEAFTAGQATAPLRWAALLHDVAKPATYSEDVDGHGHFFDHPRQGAHMARAILRRMAIPSEIADATCLLIRWHDEPMPATTPAVRRLLRRFSRACPGREVPLAFNLFDLRRADAVSKCPSAACWAHQMDAYTGILRSEIERGPVFGTRQLAVSGSDIMRALNIAPGPAVGMQMEVLLQVVMAGEVPNERDELLAWLGAMP